MIYMTGKNSVKVKNLTGDIHKVRFQTLDKVIETGEASPEQNMVRDIGKDLFEIASRLGDSENNSFIRKLLCVTRCLIGK